MRPGTYQASCNAGELAPEIHGNTGLKQYYSGLAQAVNIQPVPQGGFDLLPRTRFAADLGAPPGSARMLRFTVSRTEAYVIILEPLQAHVFLAGVPVATITTPFVAGDLALVKGIQRGETMVLFHPDHAPQRLLRGGSSSVWTLSAAAWLNMPTVDYGGSYTNVDEQWVVRLSWASSASSTGIGFTLSVDGEATISIPLLNSSGVESFPEIAAGMRAALEALAGVDDGVTVTVGSGGGLYQEFTVTFSGGRNSGQNFTLSGSFTSIDFALTTSRTRKGKIGGEAVMSTARGWPRCGIWYQDRMGLGGFKAKSSAWGVSRTGEYYDLNIELNNDAGAMLLNLDTDGGEAVVHMLAGAYLALFTETALYHLTDRALKRNSPPNAVRSPDAVGASARVPPVLQEGSILYVGREETVVYAATFDAVTTTFQSRPLSILSSHLIEGICGADLQAAADATNAQRYFLPRDDGLLVIACLIRNQEVQPFVRWVTDGAVRAVCIDGANRPHLLVDRLVDGETRRFLELFDDAALFDAAVTRTLSAPATVVTGLDMHEGATVWAEVDGWIEGPFTVSGGSITLPTAGTVVTVGRWTAPVAETLPLVRDLGGRQVLKRPVRVHTVQLDVIGTTSIAIGANGMAARAVTLARAGDPTDVPTPARTEEIIVTGLDGFTPHGRVVLTQTRPGRLQVRNITVQARV